jgi:uncharacterized membrane protein
MYVWLRATLPRFRYDQLMGIAWKVLLPLVLVNILITAFIRLIANNGYWAEIAYWMMAAGVIGGLAAAPFGFIDWTKIPAGTRARRVGLLHGVGNVAVVVLFVASWLLRRDDPRAPETLALVLSFAGAGLSFVTGWLGGELVDRLAVGVDEGAHPDAPSSLSGRPARDLAAATRRA